MVFRCIQLKTLAAGFLTNSLVLFLDFDLDSKMQHELKRLLSGNGCSRSIRCSASSHHFSRFCAILTVLTNKFFRQVGRPWSAIVRAQRRTNTIYQVLQKKSSLLEITKQLWPWSLDNPTYAAGPIFKWAKVARSVRQRQIVFNVDLLAPCSRVSIHGRASGGTGHEMSVTILRERKPPVYEDSLCFL